MAKLFYTVRCGLPTPALQQKQADSDKTIYTTIYQLSGPRRKLLQLARFMASGEQGRWYARTCRRIQSDEVAAASAADILVGSQGVRYERRCADPNRYFHVTTSARVVTRLRGRVLFAHTADDPAADLINRGTHNLQALAKAGRTDSELYQVHVSELRELLRQLIDRAYYHSLVGVHATLAELQDFLTEARNRRASLEVHNEAALKELGGA